MHLKPTAIIGMSTFQGSFMEESVCLHVCVCGYVWSCHMTHVCVCASACAFVCAFVSVRAHVWVPCLLEHLPPLKICPSSAGGAA